MKKNDIFRLTVFFLIVFTVVTLISGCGNEQQADPPLSGRKFAIVVKSEGNRYFERINEGFCAIVESKGGTPIVKQPSQATAEEQIRIIND